MPLHPLYRQLHGLVNDAESCSVLFRLLEFSIFDYVAPYVITDAGNILLQRQPRRKKKKDTFQLQAFGGQNVGENFLWQFNKLRGELRDESSISLLFNVPFRASPVYIRGKGLVQVFLVSEDWVRTQRL